MGIIRELGLFLGNCSVTIPILYFDGDVIQFSLLVNNDILFAGTS